MLDEKKSLETELSDDEIREGAPFAALSYVAFLWILVYLVKKENNYAKFHARQGLVTFFFLVACLFMHALPLIGSFLYSLGILIYLGVSLYGMYYALSGKTKAIPFVSDIAEKFVI
ncbi:MAG: hypothetical protein PHP69_03925 [Candidatus Omnitrophica bacterium]|nr:hypothetical protein [Candidatus Omnitrophota bacterium]MDD5441155.1 hypothetical protein [Candidatus Omnitrophota bacterium]